MLPFIAYASQKVDSQNHRAEVSDTGIFSRTSLISIRSTPFHAPCTMHHAPRIFQFTFSSLINSLESLLDETIFLLFDELS